MDIILQNYDFSKVHHETIDEIKETCKIFQYLSISPNAKDLQWICIKGIMVGKPMYDYYIHPVKDGFDVQVMKAGNSHVFQFAVMIFTENGVLKIHPYNNNHLY